MWTAQDVVDYLLTTTGGGAQDGEHRAIRQATIHGIREVMQCRDWLWHTKTGWFQTYFIQTTSTFTKNNTTITVGSSTGFVPGRVVSFQPGYFNLSPRVVRVDNATTITVDAPPARDGTNVPTQAQTFYDLPENLRTIDGLVSDTVGTLHAYISPQDWQRLEINTKGTSEPYYYTIMRSDTDPDNWQIRFVGVPANGTILHYTYRYTPKPMKYMGFESVCRQGTVTTTGTTAVTGTGTNFQADFKDSVIRFGTTSSSAESIGSLTPYAYEQKIREVGSTTGLTMEGSVPALAGVKYAISDLIDASPQMYTAILSAAEMWYARITGKSAGDAVALYNKDLRRALEDDTVSPMSGRPNTGTYPTPRTMGYRSALLPDTGII